MYEEKLVEAVQSLPCVWNTKEKSYKEQREIYIMWKEVAELVSDQRRANYR
jgi:hypothetical protein